MSRQRPLSDAASEEKYIDKVAPSVEHVEESVAKVADRDDELLLPEARQHAERKLVRKLDFRLLPTIVLIFLLNYIDRTAVSSARLKGLEQDLHLTDIQYETVLAVLYASYVPAQIPSNMILNRISRSELAFRSAILYGGLLISNAFGSGSITVCIGLFAIWALPDYPHNTRWLSKAERRLAQVRLAEDAGEADDDSAHDTAFTGLKQALRDPKVSILAVMTCAQLLGLSFVNFFPTPPWIFATIFCCVNAWHADRSGERFFHIVGPWWGSMVGYVIGLSTMSIGGRYFAMFLMANGYAGFALTLVWTSNAVPRPPAKRSAAIGIVNGFGNLGNLIGSYAWKAEWGPNYHPSMIIGLASFVLSSVLAFVVRYILVAENKRLDKSDAEEMTDAERERIKEAARLEGLTLDEAMERKKGFRYLY
ncbi:uncharacterized protein PHACADRAFT_163762 [Phanerochaete carnosa HHB-10118-sp]|uniref:Major facilitator superfamily (MFS) profile domain-containing protein n=1 Tax=Phanerochaete carnosa (strain HHB-10118-sp) TaxID=650164 RepID=K5VPR3_PHACS|nr:uncharacterized protein PHACADRAFT_163762 [Phanerochaete carnosa HHB-10118-sp]EKM53443.1 hypothetical protein PHACADRAFT_163762 [Phanerochaete carnosa HHB-10118-sp]